MSAVQFDARAPRPRFAGREAAGLVLAYLGASAVWFGFWPPATFQTWLLFGLSSLLIGWLATRRAQRRLDPGCLDDAEGAEERGRQAALLRALSESSTDLIVAKDREGRYLLCNPEAARLLGRPAETVIGADDAALFGVEQARCIRDSDLRVMEENRVQTFEEVLQLPDGPRTYLATKGPLRDEGGRVVGLFAMSRDVTERAALARERELVLRDREIAYAEMSSVLGRMTGGFIALDNDDRITFVSQRGAELVGHATPQTMVGHHARDIFQDLCVGPGDAARRARGSRQVVIDSVRLPGNGRWIEYQVYPSEKGLTVYYDDVTDRRRSEAALERSELRYRLAAAGGYVWYWDITDGELTIPASVWSRLGTAEPAPGQSREALCKVMHPRDWIRMNSAIREHLKRRGPYELDFRALHADGSWHWFHTQGQAVWDEDGRATYMAGTTFDVTARRLAEDALQASQQQLSDLSRRLLDQERETTQRLAQALHDGLGQTLAGARLHLDIGLGTDKAALTRASSLLDTAIHQVRGVLFDLRPSMLEATGLAESLRHELHRAYDDVGPDVALEVAPLAESQRWPGQVEYAAFMIARESVANARLHASAHRVMVQLSGNGDQLELSVSDDGVGVADHAMHGRPGHLGIVGMRERALAVGAELAIQRLTIGGTSVRLTWHRLIPQ